MTFRLRVSIWTGLVLGSATLLGVCLWSPPAHETDGGFGQLAPLKFLSAEAQTPEKPAAVVAPAKCDETYARIRKFFDSLPKDLGSLTGDAADKLAFETERTIIACGQFLAECENHAKTAEVNYVTAKLLFLMSARKRNELVAVNRDKPGYMEIVRQRMAELMSDVARLGGIAFEKLPAEHPLRPRAIELVGQACSEADRNAEARTAYEKFLELYPKDEDADKVTVALASTLLELEKYDDGIKLVKQGLEKYYTSEQFPNLCEFLWKLVHSKGDLEGMLEHVKRIDTVFPHKLSGGSLKDRERDSYERFLDFNGFRHGYTYFAMGDFAAAKAAFLAHMDALGKKAEKLKVIGKDLKPEVKIYLERSATCLKAVEELAGLPGPLELDLGNTWVSSRKVSLAESRGKVVGVIFRGVGDERSAAFIGPFSQWVARQPNMDLAVVCYRKAGQNLAQLQDELREELGRIQYEGAAGFDPDEQQKTLFRRYQANIGSATFFILNRRGEVVWFMQDPRGVDVQFARTLMSQWAQK